MRSPLEKYHKEATVSGPKRPIYITRMESSLLPTVNPGVIPVERPTVPNALVISKSACVNVNPGSINTIK